MVYVPEAIEKSTNSIATKVIEAVFHVSIHIKYVSLLSMNMMQDSGVHVNVQNKQNVTLFARDKYWKRQNCPHTSVVAIRKSGIVKFTTNM